MLWITNMCKLDTKLKLLIFMTCISMIEGKLFVTLTFDDGLSEHYFAANLLKSHGLRGTFYINSGTIGSSERMIWQNVKDMYADGHEIGGHTINHANLGDIDTTSRRREICDDHTTTESHGANLMSFAYPFGVTFPNDNVLLEDCGYSYARDSGGIATPLSCTGCPSAVELPLTQPYDIRSISYRNTMGPNFLVNLVKAAEKDFKTNDGLLAFVFHEIRNSNPPTNGIVTGDLELFVSWLQTNQNVQVDSLINIIEPPPTTTTTTTVTVAVTDPPTETATDPVTVVTDPDIPPSTDLPSVTNPPTTGDSQTSLDSPATITATTTAPQNNGNMQKTIIIILGVLLGVSVLILILLFAYRMQELYWKLHPNVRMLPEPDGDAVVQGRVSSMKMQEMQEMQELQFVNNVTYVEPVKSVNLQPLPVSVPVAPNVPIPVPVAPIVPIPVAVAPILPIPVPIKSVNSVKSVKRSVKSVDNEVVGVDDEVVIQIESSDSEVERRFEENINAVDISFEDVEDEVDTVDEDTIDAIGVPKVPKPSLPTLPTLPFLPPFKPLPTPPDSPDSPDSIDIQVQFENNASVLI